MASRNDISDESSDPHWKLVSCNVAPAFSSSEATLPSGPLTTNLHVEDLRDKTDSMGMGQFMVWANDGSCAPTQGFELLVRYVDTLALYLNLPAAQLKFCHANGDHFVPSCNAQVIAQGHHSVLTLEQYPDCVIKVSSSSIVDREMRIHLVIYALGRLNLRAAMPSMIGIVTGAGDGLKFIGLQCHLETLPTTP